jgi:signal transduction histidine kinase
MILYTSIRLPQRLLLKSYQNELDALAEALTPNEYKKAEDILRRLPKSIEFIIFTEKGEILVSKMPEISTNQLFTFDNFKTEMSKTFNKYTYHFTEKNTNKGLLYIISRTNSNYFRTKRHAFYIPYITIAIFVFITLCCISISIISRTIFKSIMKIKNETAELASGNLTHQIPTDKSLTDNEITDISRSLEEMRLSLLTVQNQKNKFIMGLSHDLRTPVSIIRGYTEAIKDGVITSPEELQNANNLILVKITQLQNMINSLIDFMKFDSHEIKKKMEINSITRTINNFIKEAKFTGAVFNRTIEIKTELIKEDIFIPFDEQLIIRALENLYNNALRYTKDNDIISFSSYIRDKTLFFSIKDTGIGIPEKDINNIFNLFFRGTNSRREEGMGIGLSVVKNIIEMHGWTISVESEQGKGSCFTIAIPISKAN